MSKVRQPLKIKEWRKYRADMSQEALADLIGMSPGNLSLLERGLINYTQGTLGRLAEALECSTSDLINRDPTAAGDEDLWDLWNKADPAQRQQLVEIARTILKPRPR